jgi:hypothetical protein
MQKTVSDEHWANDMMENVETWEDAHEGGFAKRTPALMDCMGQWETQTQIELDAIYTGKLLLALKNRLEMSSANRPSFFNQRLENPHVSYRRVARKSLLENEILVLRQAVLFHALNLTLIVKTDSSLAFHE